MELTKKDVGVLLRSLMRSMEKTPPKELPAHKAVYEKLTAESVRMMPPGQRARLSRALGRAIGE